ncbi:MAG: T9SS type A sorting domain-containing protein [bacterium]
MNKKLQILFVIILIVISNGRINSQVPNFRIHPSLNAQIEPAIVRHPVNPLIMFASSYTITNSFRSEGVYVSTNGGVNWFGSDTCNTGGSTNNHGGDPGPIIDKDGKFILTHQGNFIVGMFSNSSTDLGSSWTGNYQIATGDQDKGTPGTDDYPTSPYYGRTYLVWTKFLNPFPIVSAYTTNGGTNWSSSNQINTTPAGYISLGGDIKTNVDGAVCVTWAGVITGSPQNEKFCGFARSTNGGVNWVTNENIFAMNGVKTSSLQPWNIRINGFPHIEIDKSGSSRNGWIYIVTGEKNLLPAGTDPDIIFHRSSDNGATWSSAVRVNQDPINNGKVQYFPAINVDDAGGINIVYYDNRNISSDSMDVYLSRSTDGGDTWRDYRINEFRFRPKSVTGAVGSGNQGDNIGVVFANNRLMPVWMADNSGIYQIWTARIDLNTIGIKQISQAVPVDFSLSQNYPNPFNPSTVINYQVAGSSEIKIIIYDIAGKEITELVNERQNAGTYEVDWNASGFSSGVYYYILEANGNIIETKKMVLMK